MEKIFDHSKLVALQQCEIPINKEQLLNSTTDYIRWYKTLDTITGYNEICFVIENLTYDQYYYIRNFIQYLLGDELKDRAYDGTCKQSELVILMVRLLVDIINYRVSLHLYH